jgi:dTDP-4-amino-4,6-dideoxygalactose transaminase
MSYDFIPAAKPIIGDDERAAVDAVLATGMLAQGQQVAEFEKEFSEVLLDGRPSVAVNSGTS